MLIKYVEDHKSSKKQINCMNFSLSIKFIFVRYVNKYYKKHFFFLNMSNLFIFLSLLKWMFSRQVRLRHPRKNLYLGGHDFNPKFKKIGKSNIFIDKPSNKSDGTIFIKVKDSKNLVWDFDKKWKILNFHPKNGTKNQRFKVIHLERDIIAIESSLGGCISYTKSNDKLTRKLCKDNKKYKGQIFVITNSSGTFKGDYDKAAKLGVKFHKKGTKNLKESLQLYGFHKKPGLENTGEMDIDWGECNECIKGGFGSEKQGEDYDNVKRSSIKSTNPYSKYVSDVGNYNDHFWNLKGQGFGKFEPFRFSMNSPSYRRKPHII